MKKLIILVFLLSAVLSYGQLDSFIERLKDFTTQSGKNNSEIKNIDENGNGYYIVFDSVNTVTERGIYKNGTKYFKYEYFSDTVMYSNKDSVFCSYGNYKLVVKATKFNIQLFSPAEIVFGDTQEDSIIHINGYITKEKYFNLDSAEIFRSLQQICSKNNYQILSFDVYLDYNPCTTILWPFFADTSCSVNTVVNGRMNIFDGLNKNIENFSLDFLWSYDSTSFKKIEISFVNRKPKYLYDCEVESFMHKDEKEVCNCYHFDENGEILQKFSFLNGRFVSFYYSEIGREKRLCGIINKKKWLPYCHGIYFPLFFQFENNKLYVCNDYSCYVSLHQLFFRFCDPSETTIWQKKITKLHH